MSFPAAAQSLDPGAPVTLFRFDATSVGGPVMYFTALSQNHGGITFQGIYYTPVDVEFTDFETNGQGALPSPHVKVSSSNGVFQNIVNTVGDLQGCEFQRIRTFAQFLDGQPGADPSAFIGPDTFLVEQKVAQNPVYIEWELSASIDQAGKMLPGRTVIRDTCMWRYRVFNTATSLFDYSKAQCPYTGTNTFNYTNAPEPDPRQDQCSRTLDGCRLRFGTAAELPFGGFPGAARIGNGS